MKVTEGVHRNMTGTIKHILKSVLWLHSNSYLKDSGIFVVRSRVCMLSGSKNKSQGGLSYMGAVSPAYTPSGPGPSSGSSQGMMGRGGLGKPMQQKDSMIGKTVMIIKGG